MIHVICFEPGRSAWRPRRMDMDCGTPKQYKAPISALTTSHVSNATGCYNLLLKQLSCYEHWNLAFGLGYFFSSLSLSLSLDKIACITEMSFIYKQMTTYYNDYDALSMCPSLSIPFGVRFIVKYPRSNIPNDWNFLHHQSRSPSSTGRIF